MNYFARKESIQVGNTPSQRIERIGDVEIWAKLEYENPTGSLKDRPAFYIVRDIYERREGEIEDIILTDGSSGNYGISSTYFGKKYGFKEMIVFVPQTALPSKIEKIKEFGGGVRLIDTHSTEVARKYAREYAATDPEHIIFTNQHDNPLNHKAHYETTGREIWEQSKGKITDFIHGRGTSGTITGVGKRLKEYNPSIKIIGIVPRSQTSGIDGLRHSSDGPTEIYKKYGYVVDENVEVSDVEGMVVDEILWKRGYRVGLSSAASYYVATKRAKELEEGLIFILFADSY